jgi:hypothetical protein
MSDDGAWFRPRPSGRGLTPASWQGWACTLGLLLVIFLTTFLGDPAGDRPSGLRFQIQMRSALGLSHTHLSVLARAAIVVVETMVFYVFATWKSLPQRPRG